MFFSIFAHKFSYLSIFCHTRLQFAKTSSIHTFFCFYAAVFIKLKLRPDGVISVTQCCHILNPTQPYP